MLLTSKVRQLSINTVKSQYIEHYRTSLLDVAENRKKFHSDFDAYNITSNQSFSSEIVEISTIGNSKSNKNQSDRKKRFLDDYFENKLQVSQLYKLNIT